MAYLVRPPSSLRRARCSALLTARTRTPSLAAISNANPLFHLAEGLRGLLLGDNSGYHLGSLAGLLVLMLSVLVPLDMRLLRKRVLGD